MKRFCLVDVDFFYFTWVEEEHGLCLLGLLHCLLLLLQEDSQALNFAAGAQSRHLWHRHGWHRWHWRRPEWLWRSGHLGEARLKTLHGGQS